MKKENNIPQGYPIYDTIYGTEIPCEQYFVIKFDTLPSKFINNISYDVTIMDYLKENGFKTIQHIVTTNRRYEQTNQYLFINELAEIIIRIYAGTDKKNNLVQLDFIYNYNKGSIEEQINFTKLKDFERTKKKANIKLVKSDMGHLDTEDYDLYSPAMDLNLNYGSEFAKIHNTIIDRLNKPHDKGIILLHGDPGTGKTSYIKHLTSLIIEKDILFIPPSMAEMLSEPTIIPFLMDHKNSILIIEDAERVIGDREGNGSPAGVSNILNLTDGILGDCLNIQVVATFNMKRENIDKALLRKGRLIAEHKFEKLSVEDTNKLLLSLGKEQSSDEGMCLADIYNIDIESIKSTNKKSKIGF
jgi:hypothetical protein